MSLIGDPAGKAVVDLACGEGFYTRRVKQKGAEKVLGVDLSKRMIELARAQETEQERGIEYRVADVRGLDLGVEHDLAIAAYLLNYARDRDELGAMCDGIARCLRPGGRFVTVNSSPVLDFRTAPPIVAMGSKPGPLASFGK
jgi:ubiquinone/menaquinone biosynthesis C-methylase UbiE